MPSPPDVRPDSLMKEAYRFPKPEVTRRILAKMLGEGLLVAEGELSGRLRARSCSSRARRQR